MIRLLIVFITFFYLDSLLVLFFPLQPVVGQYEVIPNLFLTCLVIFTFFDREKRPLFLAGIFGLLYDIFYAGLLGLYPVLFLAAVFITRRFFVGKTPVNFVSILSLLMGIIAAKEWIIYFLVLTLTGLRMSFMHFVQFLLFPTLLFNALFLLLAYPVLVNQFEKYKKNQSRNK